MPTEQAEPVPKELRELLNPGIITRLGKLTQLAEELRLKSETISHDNTKMELKCVTEEKEELEDELEKEKEDHANTTRDLDKERKNLGQEKQEHANTKGALDRVQKMLEQNKQLHHQEKSELEEQKASLQRAKTKLELEMKNLVEEKIQLEQGMKNLVEEKTQLELEKANLVKEKMDLVQSKTALASKLEKQEGDYKIVKDQLRRPTGPTGSGRFLKDYPKEEKVGKKTVTMLDPNHELQGSGMITRIAGK